MEGKCSCTRQREAERLRDEYREIAEKALELCWKDMVKSSEIAEVQKRFDELKG